MLQILCKTPAAIFKIQIPTNTKSKFNTYNNTLFFGEFVQSDWDMFHSLHLAVESHGAT